MAKVDLTIFCAEPGTGWRHEAMMAPFRYANRMYATNGHICVRVPSKGPGTLKKAVRPNVKDLAWSWSFWAAAWKPLKSTGPEPVDFVDQCGVSVSNYVIETIGRPVLIRAVHFETLMTLPGIEYLTVPHGCGRHKATQTLRLRFDGGEALVVCTDPVEAKLKANGGR